MKKINERPFELVGFCYNDYKIWCEKNLKKEKDPKSKKEFFKLIYEYKLVKKDGNIVEM